MLTLWNNYLGGKTYIEKYQNAFTVYIFTKPHIFIVLFIFFSVSSLAVWNSELMFECQDEAHQFYFHKYSIKLLPLMLHFMYILTFLEIMLALFRYKKAGMEKKTEKKRRKVKEIKRETRR